jgi:hypothetical protein
MQIAYCRKMSSVKQNASRSKYRNKLLYDSINLIKQRYIWYKLNEPKQSKNKVPLLNMSIACFYLNRIPDINALYFIFYLYLMIQYMRNTADVADGNLIAY